MNDQFADDLARWEAGRLSSAGLAGRHTPAAVHEIMDLWVLLSDAGHVPVPDADRGWAAVAARLPERRREVSSAAWRLRLRVVAVVAAALLSIGSAAYAVGPPEIRDAVNGAISRIADLFRGSPGQHHRAPLPVTPSPTPAATPTAGTGPHPKPVPSVRPTESPQYRPPVFKLKRDRPGDGPGEQGQEQNEPAPDPEPTEEPTPEPSPDPTEEPSPEPSPSAEPTPSEEPSPSPTA